MVQGQGARGQLTINEKKPGLESLLLFELKASHLNDCNSKSDSLSSAFPVICNYFCFNLYLKIYFLSYLLLLPILIILLFSTISVLRFRKVIV